MALILGGGAFGEMRGKLGSMVFARNRAGAYVRSFAKPVDPNTIAQQTARSNFGAAASNFHGLTDEEKVQWQTFASMVFNPKTGTFGVPSGFNAFVSLQNVVNNAKIFDTYALTGPGVLVTTEIPFTSNPLPPTFALEANIARTGTGSSFLPFYLGSVSDLTPGFSAGISSFTGSFSLNMTGEIGSGGTTSQLADAKGNSFGFKVFMSNPVAQASMFIQNPYLIDLGCVPAVNITTPANLELGLSVGFTSELVSAKYQSLPIEDQYVQLSIFSVSSRGMLLKLGAKMAKVS